MWLEKIPYLILAALAGAVGVFGQVHAGAAQVLRETPASRVAHALYAAAFYPGKTLVPVRLLPLYPLSSEDAPLAWPYLASAATVLAVSLAAVRARRRWPALSAAWACYLAGLVPVSGVVRFGTAVVADRYSYLPCLSWAVLAAGAGLALSRRLSPSGRRALAAAAAALVVGLVFITRRQVAVWRDSERLWSHALAVEPELALAHNNLGIFLVGKGRLEEAASHYLRALSAEPDYADAHNNLAIVLERQGKAREAEEHYQESLLFNPASAETQLNLATLLAGQGRRDEAASHFREALRFRPEYAPAREGLRRVSRRKP